MQQSTSNSKKISEFIFNQDSMIYNHPDNSIIDYQDGGELYILDSMKKVKDLSSNSPEFKQYIKDWPSRYHFSHKRINFLEGLKEVLPKDADVLEIGSGCGTITRWLGEQFRSVDALEGNAQRAIITRYRTKDLDNVTVYCGNLLATNFDKKYDVITLIGSLEYIPFYDTEYEDPKTVCSALLTRLHGSLKENGVLLIAIENKFGAKYFSGCKEDHTGREFEGIIGYPDKTPVTFSRNEMGSILSHAGFGHNQFYHVFPDYKLTETIIPENPEVLSLYPHNWIKTPFEDYSGNRLNLFPDLLFLKSITDSGLLWQFSNSFVIIARPTKTKNLGVPWLIKSYRNNENLNPTFYHAITLVKELNSLHQKNEYLVQRSPLPHAYQTDSYGNFEFRLINNNYVLGKLLIYDFYTALFKKSPENALKQILTELHDNLLYIHSINEKDPDGYPLVNGEAIDFTFWNIIIESPHNFNFIDRKWRYKEPLPADLILFRNLFQILERGVCPYLTNKNKRSFILEMIRTIYPQYSEERLSDALIFERLFQTYASGRPQNFTMESPPQDSLTDKLTQNAEMRTKIESLNQSLAKNQVIITHVVELKQHAHNLEATVTDRNTQITELKQHAHNLEATVTDRNTQITELKQHAHNLEAIATDRDRQTIELRQHAHNLEAIATDRDRQTIELRQHACNLEAIVNDPNNLITELKQHTRNLEAIVTDRDHQITDLRQYARNLEDIINDPNNLITELRRHARNLEAIVSDREIQVTEFRKHSHNLEEIITNQNQQLQDVLRFNQSLYNENQSIKQSLTYNLITKFHKKIVERLLPENTRRRKYYNLGLSGSRLLINEGWDRFWLCYHERKYPQAVSTDHSIPIPRPEITSLESDDIPVIQTKVSVIIPTKNAGPDFQSVLEKIHNQKGIPYVETIIVDSGSTDGTCEIAEKFGCRIFSIKPEEFNHGRTRNYGAEQATGEFIVFLVQDAIPIGDYWLYTMVKILNADDHLAAASCRQVPRSDADLFACYSMWYHYKVMEFSEDKIVHIEKERFNQLPFSEKRKLAGLDDVCSCFKKDIFDQVKFENLNFAEDLGIGIRFIENGYKLAFLYSAGVIHSHNRDAEYFLRRYYVDSKSLAEISEVPATPDNRDLNQVINSFKVLYLNMRNSLTRVKTQYPDEINVDHFFSVLERNLDSHDYVNTICSEETPLEKLLSEMFVLSTAGPVDMTQFTREFSGILDNFQKYVRNQCDTHNTNDLIENSYKFFAIYFGSHVGNLYVHHSTDKTMQSIDAILKKGV